MNYFKGVRDLTKTERVVSGLEREQLDRVVWEREHVDLVPRYYHNLEEEKILVHWWDGHYYNYYKKEATLAHSYLDEMGMHMYSKSCTTLSRFILTPRTGVGQVNSRTIFCAASSKIITWEQNWCEDYPVGAKSKHFRPFLGFWHDTIALNLTKERQTKQNEIWKHLFLDTDRVVGKLWLPAACDHGDQVGPIEHLGNHQAAHLGSSSKNYKSD